LEKTLEIEGISCCAAHDKVQVNRSATHIKRQVFPHAPSPTITSFLEGVSNAANNSSGNNYLRISAIMHYASSVSDRCSVEVLWKLFTENLKPRRWRGYPNKVKSGS
jgi:hypothetical protein